jgi:hypothetical protein
MAANAFAALAWAWAWDAADAAASALIKPRFEFSDPARTASKLGASPNTIRYYSTHRRPKCADGHNLAPGPV